MPLLTPEELTQKIASGEIRAISIDTSIFDQKKLGLESGLLKRLYQFKGSPISFVLSDVIEREVLSHLIRDAEEASSTMKKAIKAVTKAWKNETLIPEDLNKSLYLGLSPAEVSKKRTTEFQANTGAVIVRTADYKVVDSVLDRYFKEQAPFSKREEKKHEFPDALALTTIEEWAKEKGTMVLIVSGDNGWKNYCSESLRLACLSDLDVALRCFQKKVAEDACSILEREIANGDASHIHFEFQKALDEQDWKIEFLAEADSSYYFETETIKTNLSLKKIEEGLEPVDFNENSLVVNTRAVVEADVSFNATFSVWDSIDKEYVSLDSAVFSRQEEIEIEFLLTLQGDFSCFKSKIAEDAKIGEIEIPEQTILIQLGEIGPDWGPEED